MKALVFSMGADRYALPLRAVARVLPAMALKQIPMAPAFVAGLMDLHGHSVPVLDVAALSGMPGERLWLDSRIVLVDYADPAGGKRPRPLGLLLEHVIGIETLDDATLADAGIAGAPFLGQVSASTQLIEVSALLAPEVRALLFNDTPPAPEEADAGSASAPQDG